MHDSLTQLQGSHIALLAVGHPTHPDYLFRLSELSIQRDIQLAAIKQDCESRRHVAQRLYDMEVERIEDEHELAKKGVKERLLEACEERTKKLREEKDGVELNLGALNVLVGLLVMLSCSFVGLLQPQTTSSIPRPDPMLRASTGTTELPTRLLAATPSSPMAEDQTPSLCHVALRLK